MLFILLNFLILRIACDYKIEELNIKKGENYTKEFSVDFLSYQFESDYNITIIIYTKEKQIFKSEKDTKGKNSFNFLDLKKPYQVFLTIINENSQTNGVNFQYLFQTIPESTETVFHEKSYSKDLSFSLLPNITKLSVYVMCQDLKKELSIKIINNYNGELLHIEDIRNTTALISTDPTMDLSIEVLKKEKDTKYEIQIDVSFSLPVIDFFPINDIVETGESMNITKTNTFVKGVLWAFDYPQNILVKILKNQELVHQNIDTVGFYEVDIVSTDNIVVLVYNKEKKKEEIFGRIILSENDYFRLNFEFEKKLNYLDMYQLNFPLKVMNFSHNSVSNGTIKYEIFEDDLPTRKVVDEKETLNFTNTFPGIGYIGYNYVISNKEKDASIVKVVFDMIIDLSIERPVWNPTKSIIIAASVTVGSLFIILLVSIVICVFSPKARINKEKKIEKQEYYEAINDEGIVRDPEIEDVKKI